MDCGDYALAKNLPKGCLGLFLLLPAVCSSAHLPKVPSSNFARRPVLLESLLSAHLKMFPSPSLIIPEHKQKWILIFTKGKLGAKGDQQLFPEFPGHLARKAGTTKRWVASLALL